MQYFQYDEKGNQTHSWYYWDDGLPTPVDYCKVTTITEYDDAGRVAGTLRQISETGGSIDPCTVVLSQTEYNKIGKVDFSINETGQLTKYEYDELGNLVETKIYESLAAYQANPITNILTTSQTLYDKEGRVLVTVDTHEPGQAVNGTENVYDALGRMLETRRWADVVIAIENVTNDSGQTVGKRTTGWTKAAMLSYSRTEYDTAGRVKMTVALDEDGYEQPTSYVYDKAGKQTAVIDPLGHTITYIADGPWHVIQSYTLNGTHKTITEYEGTRRKSVTDSRNNTMGFRYDAVGKLLRVEHPSVPTHGVTYTHTGYDGLGRKSWQSNQVTQAEAGDVPDSEIKDFEYDSSSRLTAAVLPQVADPENSNTNTYPRYEYKYDEYGNLKAIWDKIKQYPSSTDYTHKRVTSFTYDHLSNQTSRKLPNNSIEYKWYDEFGRIEKAKDFKGQVIGYFYNNRGLPEYQKYYDSEADYPDEPNSVVQYTYDNLGRKEQIIEGRGTTTYHYDTEGNVTRIDSPEGVIHYDYSNITGRKDRTWTAGSPADPCYVYQYNSDYPSAMGENHRKCL